MFSTWKENTQRSQCRIFTRCRPALPSFKKDPLPVLRILERLKADPSLYVCKNVANSLNDISKNHPDLIVGLAKDWYGKNEHTDWIVKHILLQIQAQGSIIPVFIRFR